MFLKRTHLFVANIAAEAHGRRGRASTSTVPPFSFSGQGKPSEAPRLASVRPCAALSLLVPPAVWNAAHHLTGDRAGPAPRRKENYKNRRAYLNKICQTNPELYNLETAIKLRRRAKHAQQAKNRQGLEHRPRQARAIEVANHTSPSQDLTRALHPSAPGPLTYLHQQGQDQSGHRPRPQLYPHP